jgi:hypothetical protein
MKVVLAATCDAAQERPDGKLDVRGAFHELYAPGFPARQDRLTLVLVMAWEPHEVGQEQRFRADLVDESGTMIVTVQGETEVQGRQLEGAPPQTRLIMELTDVVFRRPGWHHFEIQAGGETHRGCPLYVGEQASGRS